MYGSVPSSDLYSAVAASRSLTGTVMVRMVMGFSLCHSGPPRSVKGYDGRRARSVTMSELDLLASRFEADRAHLRTVAQRILGSTHEADDAVQETWMRLSRTDTADVDNLTGWLTTVVSRVCLDMLRARTARREEPAELPPAVAADARAADPEHEALLADAIGPALLVVLDTLGPSERLAFVLHDMFAVPFPEIAEIVGCSPAAARQLASRARRRVQGSAAPDRETPEAAPDEDVVRRRTVVDAFLAASRGGDFAALLALL